VQLDGGRWPAALSECWSSFLCDQPAVTQPRQRVVDRRARQPAATRQFGTVEGAMPAKGDDDFTFCERKPVWCGY
jgi:hypothetical protein